MPGRAAAQRPTSRLLELPDCLIHAVLHHLRDIQALGRCATSCRQLHRAAAADALWRPFLGASRGAPLAARRPSKAALRALALREMCTRRWRIRMQLTASEFKLGCARSSLEEVRAAAANLEESIRRRASGRPFWEASADPTEALRERLRLLQPMLASGKRNVEKLSAEADCLSRREAVADAAVKRCMASNAPSVIGRGTGQRMAGAKFALGRR
jgi:hypothetical protein